MARYILKYASVQPAIPNAHEKPIEWDLLNAAQRDWITKATEVRIGKAFPPRLRDKIVYGSFFQLSERSRNQLYATDWKAVLLKMAKGA